MEALLTVSIFNGRPIRLKAPMAGGLSTATILWSKIHLAEFSSELRPLWYMILLARVPLAETFTDGRPFNNGFLPCSTPHLAGRSSDSKHLQTETFVVGDLNDKRSLWQRPLGEDCLSVSVRV